MRHVRHAERCFEQSLYKDNAGLDFDQDLVHFLDAIDVEFRPLRHAAAWEPVTFVFCFLQNPTFFMSLASG